MYEKLERICTPFTQIFALCLASFLAIPFLRSPFFEQQPVTPELWIDLIQNLP